jgi:tyrosine-protein kinase Etk/Wzc
MSDSLPPKRPADERSLLEGLLDYLGVLLSYKWLITITTLLAMIVAVIFSVVSLMLPPDKSPLPNRYTATAVLIMQQQQTVGLESALASLGLTPPAELGRSTAGFDIGQLAVKVLQSREILDRLVQDLDIVQKYRIQSSARTTSREIVLSRSKFSYDRTTGSLTIGFESIDPTFSRDVVARMVALLEDWFSSRGGTSRLKQKNLLEEKLASISSDISKLEDQIKQFQERYGVLKVEDLAASQSKILDDLRSQLMVKEMDIQNYQRFVKIEDPSLAKLRSERDNLLEQIKKVEDGFTNPSGTLMPAQQELPALALRFENLNSALTIQKSIYEALSQQYELTKLYVESEPAFQILESPEIPDEKSGPSRGRICIIATLVAFLGSAALALLLNTLRKNRTGSGMLTKLTGRVQ